MRRAAGLLGYARMPVRVRKRASQNPSCTPCNTASLDVYRAPPNSKRLGMSSAFFPPFLPFPRRLTGILRRDHTPAGACALTPPAAPYNGDRGGSMARYPTGEIGRLQLSHTPKVRARSGPRLLRSLARDDCRSGASGLEESLRLRQMLDR